MRPEGLTRELLLAWLAEVNTTPGKYDGIQSGAWRGKRVGAVAAMIQFAKMEGTDRIPANAMYLPRELPARDQPKPRFLEPRVIDTLRKPENLLRIADPSHRTAILIMMQVGLRAGHTCALPFDCLIDLNRAGESNRWALSFIDTKSDMTVTVPVEPHVASAIREQQVRAKQLSAGFGKPQPEFLFPNPRAYLTKRLAQEPLNKIIKAWVKDLDVREHSGELVHVTAHRFRHTFATEMLAKGVSMVKPQHVV